MKDKPITPYARLLTRAKELARAVKYPARRVMWTYPKAKINEGWTLGDLMQRVQAADQLGYDVLVRSNDEGLRVEYVKRPDVPWDWA